MDPPSKWPAALGTLSPWVAWSVHPGDFVMADADGVMVVERDKVESLLPLAARKVADEAARVAAIGQGNTGAPWLTAALVKAGVLKQGESL